MDEETLGFTRGQGVAVRSGLLRGRRYYEAALKEGL